MFVYTLMSTGVTGIMEVPQDNLIMMIAIIVAVIILLLIILVIIILLCRRYRQAGKCKYSDLGPTFCSFVYIFKLFLIECFAFSFDFYDYRFLYSFMPIYFVYIFSFRISLSLLRLEHQILMLNEVKFCLYSRIVSELKVKLSGIVLYIFTPGVDA